MGVGGLESRAKLGIASSTRSPLVKDNLADALRDEITSGQLRPGEPIVETRWAARLKVAQASVREALNILASEGLVQKSPGRSAHVTKLGYEDVKQIYQIRAALEGLAARLIAETKPDLTDLDQIIEDMRSAAVQRNVTAFYQRDLHFHLLLAEKSGNPYLADDLKRHLVPLFAFVVLRLNALSSSNPAAWEISVEEHRQIVSVLKTGDPVYAEHHVMHAIRKFGTTTSGLLGQADEPRDPQDVSTPAES